MAACMAMGAAGVWCGSVWLTTPEAETTPTVKKMLESTLETQYVLKAEQVTNPAT